MIWTSQVLRTEGKTTTTAYPQMSNGNKNAVIVTRTMLKPYFCTKCQWNVAFWGWGGECSCPQVLTPPHISLCSLLAVRAHCNWGKTQKFAKTDWYWSVMHSLLLCFLSQHNNYLRIICEIILQFFLCEELLESTNHSHIFNHESNISKIKVFSITLH